MQLFSRACKKKEVIKLKKFIFFKIILSTTTQNSYLPQYQVDLNIFTQALITYFQGFSEH